MVKTNTPNAAVSADVRDRVLKEFRRYEPYAECLRDLENRKASLSYEDRLSYHCPSNIDSEVRATTVCNGGGQPERDALRMSDIPDQIRVIRNKLDALERALNTASRQAQVHNRKKVFTALYDNLVQGVSLSSLKNGLRISQVTFARYRERAIYEAAVNLKYITSE